MVGETGATPRSLCLRLAARRKLHNNMIEASISFRKLNDFYLPIRKNCGNEKSDLI